MKATKVFLVVLLLAVLALVPASAATPVTPAPAGQVPEPVLAAQPPIPQACPPGDNAFNVLEATWNSVAFQEYQMSWWVIEVGAYAENGVATHVMAWGNDPPSRRCDCGAPTAYPTISLSLQWHGDDPQGRITIQIRQRWGDSTGEHNITIYRYITSPWPLEPTPTPRPPVPTPTITQIPPVESP